METTTRTLPIPLQTLDLSFFPEGGVLAAGLPGRVYLEARTPWGDPADLVARLVDAGTGEPVGADGRPLPADAPVAAGVRIVTVHEGRGVLGFTPLAGRAYALAVVEPAGLDARFDLPPVEEAAAVLRPVAERIAAGKPIGFRLAARDPAAPLRVELASRERVVGVVHFADGPGADTAEVRFNPPASVDGILRATVFDGDDRPVAERLVFREPARKLRVEVETASEEAVPGGEVELTVRTLDAATGAPVAAGVGITVTDDAELSVVQPRDVHPRLPAMALLESELVLSGGLKDPDAYLAGGAAADAALDLLLATRGWRRFAFVDPDAFVADHGDAARRVLGRRVEPVPMRLRREAAFAGPLAAVPAAALDEPAETPATREAAPAVAAEPAADRQDAAPRLELGDRIAIQQAADFVAVRTYAHPPPVSADNASRSDPTATVFFADRVHTDADGRATVRFHTSGRVTGLRILADAVDARGALGAADTLLPTVRPFSLALALPAEVTQGDELVLEVTAANRTGEDFDAVLAAPRIVGPAELLGPRSADSQIRRVPADGRASVSHRLRITGPGEVTISLTGDSPAGADAFTRTLIAAPRGFPVAIARGGTLETDGSAVHTVTVPDDVVPGSLIASVEVHPTPTGSLTAGLQGLIRQPSGCFEQTSSTSYPLVMAQRYFLGHADTDPVLIAESAALLEAAYAKLTSFETPKRGYEWFGAAPGHAALTAYGLMQFVEMGEVRRVDPAMVERTRAWLLSRRDGEGGFAPDGKALDSFGRAPADVTDAYITWALVNAGETALGAELDRVAALAETTDDPYILALSAGSLHATRPEAAAAARARLAEMQATDGSVPGAATSITSSGGAGLLAETTALAALAFLDDPARAAETERAVRFLSAACEGGRFGSTQGTVLALRAVVAHDAARSRPLAPGTLILLVDGTPVGEPLAFDAETAGTLTLPDPSALLTPGEHRIELRMTGGAEMPYAVSASFHREQPETADDAPLVLAVSLSEGSADRSLGEPLEAMVRVSNTTGTDVSMPLAIVGLPAGLTSDADHLQELVDAGRIAAYGLRAGNREVVLYWRGLGPGDSVDLPIRLTATTAGSFTAPASRVYPYYDDTRKSWAAPLQVRVVAAP